jgi:hypothetical protein
MRNNYKMNVWPPQVKSLRQARAIALGLNYAKPGSGDYYLEGYQSRQMTEQAAVTALQGNH